MQVLQLEALACAATSQELDACGALACLSTRSGRYLIHRTTFSVGRSTETKGEVDVNLSRGGPATKVSRCQAYVSLEADEKFTMNNVERRALHVNGMEVVQFGRAELPHLGVLEVGDVRLLFMVNQAAVQRVMRRMKRAKM
mmetsp:Transcript_28765/g.63366  ORF Transcript_28765/g.63366 Transcript_28765/m.63366 type:complete len:141 (+) Transcript_28765:268-690(+)